MFMKRGAILAIALGVGLMISLTVVDVSEAQVAATQAEVLVVAAADSGESLASVFGLARCPLYFHAYQVAQTCIARLSQSRR